MPATCRRSSRRGAAWGTCSPSPSRSRRGRRRGRGVSTRASGRRRWPTSVRARLTLWYTVVLGAPLVLFAAASLFALDRVLLRRTDHFLDAALAAFGTTLDAELYEVPTT